MLVPIIVLVLIATAVLLRVRQAIGMRARDQSVINKKRHTNKRINNRLVMTIGRAGKRHSLFALVHHVGRKSGKQYVTPVRLVRHDNEFTIPLTYGERSDWYQNLRAVGNMEIQWQGRNYQVGHPEELDFSHAIHDFNLLSRFLFWLDGVPAFVRVTAPP